jgi:ABC-type branched-subunit amino acid transport system ATPase component
LPEIEGIIMGALTVIVLIAFPTGIVGAWQLLLHRFRRRGAASTGTFAMVTAATGRIVAAASEFSTAHSDRSRDSLLTVESAARAFGNLRAVDDVSFAVPKHSITSLIGSNGAGKTTMFDMISGLQTFDSGRASFEGHRIEAQQPHAIARLGVARSFQNLELFDNLTVIENVMAGTHRYTSSGVMATLARLPSVARHERESIIEAERCLAFVGMSGFAGYSPSTLSFGQQRLVEIARALALKPSVFLMDEPASGLNDTETEQLAYLLLQIRAAGITILLIEHDLRLVMGVSDHLVVMNYGRKIAEGAPDQVRVDPDVVAAYIGAR